MQRRSVASSSWATPILIVYALLLLIGLGLTWHFWPTQVQTGSDPDAKPRPIAHATTTTNEEKKSYKYYC